MYNFKIVELIINMIVNSAVNDEQLNALSYALCVKINTLSLSACLSINFSVFGTYSRILLPPCTLISEEFYS